jgi:hypothetical protein
MRYREILEAVIKLGSFKAAEGSPAYNFMQELEAETRPNPLNKAQRIIGLAKVEMSTQGSMTVRLSDIQSSARGAGSEALAYVCKLADKHDVAIKLTAFGYAGTPTETLVKWYKKHGFVVTDEEEDCADMVREPK